MVIAPLWFRWLLWRLCPLQDFAAGFVAVGIVLAQVVVVPGLGCLVVVVVVVVVGQVGQLGCHCLASFLGRLALVWFRVLFEFVVLVEFLVGLVVG